MKSSIVLAQKDSTRRRHLAQQIRRELKEETSEVRAQLCMLWTYGHFRKID